MSKIIGAVIVLTVTAIAIVAWSTAAVVKPEMAAADAMTARDRTSHLFFRRHDNARQQPSFGRLAPGELMPIAGKAP